LAAATAAAATSRRAMPIRPATCTLPVTRRATRILRVMRTRPATTVAFFRPATLFRSPWHTRRVTLRLRRTRLVTRTRPATGTPRVTRTLRVTLRLRVTPTRPVMRIHLVTLRLRAMCTRLVTPIRRATRTLLAMMASANVLRIAETTVLSAMTRAATGRRTDARR
jgi:hypothetical protein